MIDARGAVRFVRASIVVITFAIGHGQVFADVVNWNFIEAVGGLSIKAPTRTSTGWALPVEADVSGLSKVTVQPTLLNSALACVETRADIEGTVIFLSVVTGLVGSGRSPRCPAAKLGAIVPGSYAVKYRGRDRVEVAVGNAVIASTKEARVLAFSFEIPDRWYVEGNGTEKLFASGAVKALAPPVVLAQGCVPSATQRCATDARFPPRERQGGCANAPALRIPRRDRIVETRWICDSVMIEGRELSSGFASFEVEGVLLYVSYLADERDQSAKVFLDSFGKSVKHGAPATRRER